MNAAETRDYMKSIPMFQHADLSYITDELLAELIKRSQRIQRQHSNSW